jgi:hypothetical protein
MLYFDTLPKVLNQDQNGNYILLTNLLARARILEDLQDNAVVFYKYNIQEGDTPETVAHKYYGDPYKYWIVMYSNQLMDPLWDWPMNYQTFTDYLIAKYQAEFIRLYNSTNYPVTIESLNLTEDELNKLVYAYVQSTVYRYEKITTTTDLESNLVTVTKNSIDFDDYYALAESTTTYNIPGIPLKSAPDAYVEPTRVTVSISKNIVYIYDYENDLNESRREIKLLNQAFAGDMEEQFKILMRT